MSNAALKIQNDPLHAQMANAIRFLAIDAVEKAQSGHPGMPMGLADVATVLYRYFLKFMPEDPEWADRDRVILSNGHGSMLLYALLHLTGYEDMTIDEIKNFRQLDSLTPGHPEYGHTPGVETTTGPLGQGLANAVGMAIAEAHLSAKFSKDFVDHYTYVFLGDGCLMEGISHEACSLAGHLKLNKLIALFDDNQISIDGPTSLSTSDQTLKRFESYNWAVMSIDGHDPVQIYDAISKARQSDRPVLIACKTKIAFGAVTKEGKCETHGAPLGEAEIKATREKLGWSHKPFVIPDQILDEWRAIPERNAEAFTKWIERIEKIEGSKKDEMFSHDYENLFEDLEEKFKILKKDFSKNPRNQATRQSSGDVIDYLTDFIPGFIGGSADLTGSNNTHSKKQNILNAQNYAGTYLHYGVREHAMAAIMNGMALHKGIIPYGGTFLCFTDYCKPAIRLSALMGTRVIYVMTHDSIGLGEDGPTHQPIEHLAGLRAIPNLLVFRPADAVEVLESWQIALAQEETPSVIVLSRQKLPALRKKYTDENLTAGGAYVLEDIETTEGLSITLVATGSEVSLAYEVWKDLKKDVDIRLVSMPSWELFETQDEDYKQSVFPYGTIIFTIEAASTMGWERFAFSPDTIIGIDTFGASAKAQDLYECYGLTVPAIIERINDVIEEITLGMTDEISD
ncbi:MAG: transketolase [Alphaproteobacteria bacterium]|nr:transketolase [Alphaproteobacteria bacterium]